MTEPVYYCRLEYLTASGWVIGHSGVRLLHPEKYVERLEKRGKFGRVTNLDTGEVFQSEATLRGLPKMCTVCSSTEHESGMCLL